MRNASSIPMQQNLLPNLSLWVGGLLLVGALWFVLVEGMFHLLLAIILGGTILAISRTNKALSAILTIGYLFIMGDVRRIVALLAPQPAFDPLLLIGPVVGLVLALPALARLRLKDGLSKAMLALLVVMALQIFNPTQGSLSVGLSGAFFYIVPVLWFWVGRSLASPELIERLLYRVLTPLAVAAAALGLCQTFIGFLPYQQAWIDLASRVYTSLYVGASVRPFGFSISAAEYATLLVFGTLIVFAALFAGKRSYILLSPLLITSLVLASGRGVIVKTVFTLVVVWMVRKGQKLNPFTLAGIVVFGVLSLAGLSYVASRYAPPEESPRAHTTAAQAALSHQLGGLGHPFDKKYSTAGLHSAMALGALTQGISHPLGFGLGSTTFAGQKLDSNSSKSADFAQGSSEVDLSDMFTALGVIGGIIYLVVAGLVLREVVGYVQTTPRAIGLPVLALVVSTVGGWLVGGQYSTSALLFFLFGALAYQKNNVTATLPLIESANRYLALGT